MNVSNASTSTALLQAQQARFQSADADGNGALSLSEFQSAQQNVQGPGNKGPPPPKPDRSASGANFSADTMASLLDLQQSSASDPSAALFSAADADGDGAVTQDEMAALKPPHGPRPPEGPPPGEAEDPAASSSTTTNAADTNGDGVVSMAELLQSLSDSADTLGSDVSSETGDLLRKLLAQLSSALTPTDPAATTTATEVTA